LTLAGAAGAVLAAPAVVPSALAQAPWPNKPVHFIVPFPPGQAADIFARLMAEKLTTLWKQQVIVENKAGGSGIPATEYGKAATPDGYTLTVVSSGTFGVNPSLFPDLPYRPLIDFLPISNIILVPLVIVAHPSFPAKTLDELIELARKEPGNIPMHRPARAPRSILPWSSSSSAPSSTSCMCPTKAADPPWPICWAATSC